MFRRKQSLQGLLNDTDKRVDEWLETAEKCFDFAENARRSFEVGGIDDKKHILSALGSNFLLKDKKVFINWDNMFIPFLRASKEAKVIHARFEPLNNIATQKDYEHSYAQSPELLPR